MVNLPEADGEHLRPTAAERRFDEVLKHLGLHHTQSTCGLGWVERRPALSGRYFHTAALDVANESVRQVLPSRRGRRGLFRFAMPRSDTDAPHLTYSGQKLPYIPGVELNLPENPDLELDIAALFMLIKAEARRVLDSHELELTAENETTLMAIWYGHSYFRSDFDQDFGNNKTAAKHPEIATWLRAEVPTYLTLLKFVRPSSARELTLDIAKSAQGIPASRFAALYPITEKEDAP